MYEINLVNIKVLYLCYSMSSKNRATVATYLKWRKDNVCNKKIIEKDGTGMWQIQKYCGKYKSEIHRESRGSAKAAALAFLDGTKNVKSSDVNINFLSHIFQA